MPSPGFAKSEHTGVGREIEQDSPAFVPTGHAIASGLSTEVHDSR